MISRAAFSKYMDTSTAKIFLTTKKYEIHERRSVRLVDLMDYPDKVIAFKTFSEFFRVIRVQEKGGNK
jgi:hypothetical protein